MEHPSSRDTFDTIAQWAHPDLPYSTKDKWDRYGFIGMFADYVLSCTRGCIVEIGAGESSIYLSRVARKYNRRIFHCDISPSKLVNPLSIPEYIALPDEATYFEERDPVPPFKRSVCFAGSSDKLLHDIVQEEVAFAFIDGDHLYEQARRDFWNLWPKVVDHGYVMLHDTYPPNKDWTDENHCGEVWKLRKELERNLRMDVLTLTRGTAIGVGLTIVRKHPLLSEEFHDG